VPPGFSPIPLQSDGSAITSSNLPVPNRKSGSQSPRPSSSNRSSAESNSALKHQSTKVPTPTPTVEDDDDAMEAMINALSNEIDGELNHSK
jgi:hypothetical protein